MTFTKGHLWNFPLIGNQITIVNEQRDCRYFPQNQKLIGFPVFDQALCTLQIDCCNTGLQHCRFITASDYVSPKTVTVLITYKKLCLQIIYGQCHPNLGRNDICGLLYIFLLVQIFPPRLRLIEGDRHVFLKKKSVSCKNKSIVSSN